MSETLVYPVGVLSTLQRIRAALRLGRYWNAKSALRAQVSYLSFQTRARNWRAVRNSFNGYLAEHDGHPHNAGTGWTRKAALRRVNRICVKSWQS